MPKERTVLVGVGLKREAEETRSSLEELRRLAETAGAEVVGEITQNLDRFQAATLIGKGKSDEIALSVKARQANTVIFDKELSAAQQKNLEKICRAKIIDRTRLILDIFAQRARTNEGRLQVELAQLSYTLPRLTGSWRAYSQQVGGIGTRGPGERQLEYERRHIQYRILHIKDELKKVKLGRDLRRRRRHLIPVPEVALIGYTNVGKSTLLNALTGANAAPVGTAPAGAAYADDKLFATLDPMARRVRLGKSIPAIFVDTVGFISRLPTQLVAAFRSTLEEVKSADCLILVADASSPHEPEQRRAVIAVLKDLQAHAIPRLLAFNKIDRLTAAQKEALRRRHPEACLISAENREGLGGFLERVSEVLAHRWSVHEISVPAVLAGRFLSRIRASSQLLSSEFGESDRALLRLRATPENWRRIRSLAENLGKTDTEGHG